MRYSFDTVRVNTQVRGDNTSLSTLHGLLVVPRVKDFPKLSSWFNIHLAPVNTPVITDICTCSVTLGFPSILIPVYLLNIHIPIYVISRNLIHICMYIKKVKNWPWFCFEYLFFLIFIKFLVFDMNTSSDYFFFYFLKFLFVKLTIKLKSRNAFVS